MTRLVISLVCGLLGAAIVHIVAVLAVPELSRSDAEARALELGAEGRFTPFPARDPLLRQAICLVRLDRPVRVFAGGAVPFWSTSIVTPAGVSVYSINDRTSREGGLDLIIARESAVDDLRETLAEDAPELVALSEDRALVVVRALTPDDSYSRSAAAFIESATCDELDMVAEG